jgi:ABC-type antimicrobial peptide transport system permease subunit
MSPFLRVPLGIAIIAVGILIVWKTETVYTWFGANDWAERKLGVGQSRLFYKLIGVGIAMIGVFTATNIISDILTAFASIFVRK